MSLYSPRRRRRDLSSRSASSTRIVDDVAPPSVAGERVVIQGRVLDGDGKPVDDA